MGRLVSVQEMEMIFKSTPNKLACSYIYMLYDVEHKFGVVTQVAPNIFIYYPPETLPEGESERAFVEQTKNMSTGAYFFNNKDPVIIINSSDPFLDLGSEEEYHAAICHEAAHMKRPPYDEKAFIKGVIEEIIADDNAIREGYARGMISILKKVRTYHKDNKNTRKIVTTYARLANAYIKSLLWCFKIQHSPQRLRFSGPLRERSHNNPLSSAAPIEQ